MRIPVCPLLELRHITPALIAAGRQRCMGTLARAAVDVNPIVSYFIGTIGEEKLTAPPG